MYKIRLSITILLTFFFLGQTFDNNPDRHLFKIIENDMVGYIDSTGKVIIKPIFHNAGEFSEGVAAARLNGTYGYINMSGEFVIPPQYDYAEPFIDSIAKVYINGIPFYINHKGEKLFDCNFSKITNFKENRARVETESGKVGAINKNGNLIIDTIYKYISEFNEGSAVVHGLFYNPYSDDNKSYKNKIGIIDSMGNFLVSFGKHRNIYNYCEGFYRYENDFEEDKNTKTVKRIQGFIDSKGKEISSIEFRDYDNLKGDLKCGLAKFSSYKRNRNYHPGDFTSDSHYESYLNVKGIFVINDTNYKYVEDFSFNRAFVKFNDYSIQLIDTYGKILLKNIQSVIPHYYFRNGLAFVCINHKWGLIDTNAIFLIEPKFESICENGLSGNYFFFEKKYSRKKVNDLDKDTNITLVGISKTDGKIILEPKIENFNGGWFDNGLFKCYSNERIKYFNVYGNLIWEQKEKKSDSLVCLNIDYMMRSYFFAYSKSHKNDLGGYWQSDNQPNAIVDMDGLEVNKLNLFVNRNLNCPFDENYNGLKVLIANTTANNIFFRAQDSRLHMNVMALDINNNWRDIEYIPNSWCGNSYHTLTLEPNNYWSFVTPIYKGSFKTKLKIKLEYLDPNDTTSSTISKKKFIIYSNEYEGSINPGQFWKRLDYYPSGVMDPYNE